MLLKNHLIEVFIKSSLENNILLKENIIIKWVHRFGIDSLDDLLTHSPGLVENQQEENQEQISLIDENYEEENQEQISLIDENYEEENQEQIRLESLKKLENSEETNYLEIPNNNQFFNTNKDSNNVEQLSDIPKSPLPNIKNFRKWINKDKKAS